MQFSVIRVIIYVTMVRGGSSQHGIQMITSENLFLHIQFWLTKSCGIFFALSVKIPVFYNLTDNLILLTSCHLVCRDLPPGRIRCWSIKTLWWRLKQWHCFLGPSRYWHWSLYQQVWHKTRISMSSKAWLKNRSKLWQASRVSWSRGSSTIIFNEICSLSCSQAWVEYSVARKSRAGGKCPGWPGSSSVERGVEWPAAGRW